MVLIIAVFSMFCSVLCVQAEPILLSPARAECTRAGLQGKVEEYLDRLENGKLRYVHTLTVCPDGCELPSSKEGAKAQ